MRGRGRGGDKLTREVSSKLRNESKNNANEERSKFISRAVANRTVYRKTESL